MALCGAPLLNAPALTGNAMKQLLDFLPLVVFFIFYKLYDIFVASGALIVATGLALVVSWVLYRKLEKMTLFTFALVTVFGTLTLVFHNDEFIKWKVTVIYSLFALALLYSQFFMEQPLIQRMLGKELQLPGVVWRRLNIAWAIFFFVCGLVNIYVAFWLSQEFWVNFKVFGLTGLTLLFTLFSGVYIWRQMPQQEQK
jgi:intracellular septation protein